MQQIAVREEVTFFLGVMQQTAVKPVGWKGAVLTSATLVFDRGRAEHVVARSQADNLDGCVRARMHAMVREQSESLFVGSYDS